MLSERLFPYINDAALALAAPYRAELLRHTHGVTLDIGFGSGLNLPHFNPAATEIVAVEPSDRMWTHGLKRRRRFERPLRRVRGFGHALPLETNSVDCAVCTFVLCSVPSIPEVLDEIARVLRPQGTLLILEHESHPDPAIARAQRIVTPVWKKLFEGCEPGRCITHSMPWERWKLIRTQAVSFWWMPRVIAHHRMAQYQLTGA